MYCAMCSNCELFGIHPNTENLWEELSCDHVPTCNIFVMNLLGSVAQNTTE